MPSVTAPPLADAPPPDPQVSQTPGAPNPTTGSALYLTVFKPMDEAVVNTAEIEVFGMVPPETVVTVNDEILYVGPEQEFEVVITLDEGPNLIEIVASDLFGNETSQLLTVFYEP